MRWSPPFHPSRSKPHPERRVCLPVDSRLRATATLVETRDIPIGTQGIVNVVVEREGADKPVCIAEVIYVMAGA